LSSLQKLIAENAESAEIFINIALILLCVLCGLCDKEPFLQWSHYSFYARFLGRVDSPWLSKHPRNGERRGEKKGLRGRQPEGLPPPQPYFSPPRVITYYSVNYETYICDGVEYPQIWANEVIIGPHIQPAGYFSNPAKLKNQP
jgi:hypothetical protein